ncbi:universal stress protein [Ectobacillus antri]|uniref:Universal stress protein n=2 Tax=Ectobacillus antri TaxID=2486280 RepID=A0ABT6H546_9BACI|nr:universal stress protein [Ectobacillus antri]MDG4656516.1 universal stress protein [Ectobacillus antri]MDG5753566.1 universal stress protein [Ectobacillus antri]
MMTAYRNILVAVDGSKEAEKAFKKAIHVAKRNQAKLTITHIVDIKAYSAVEAYSNVIAERANSFAEDLLEGYKKTALDEGLQVEAVLEFGNPKSKISKDVAPKHNVDLIVCGATGLNAVERFLIGSVSEHIIRYATCDVLVVRGEEEQGKL